MVAAAAAAGLGAAAKLPLTARRPQVGDLGEGAVGVVKLMRDRTTGELLAVKHLPRGDAVSARRWLPAAEGAACRLQRGFKHPPLPGLQVPATAAHAILNWQRLSGHPNIIAFKNVGAAARPPGRCLLLCTVLRSPPVFHACQQHASMRPAPRVLPANRACFRCRPPPALVDPQLALPPTAAAPACTCAAAPLCPQVYLTPSHMCVALEYAPGGTLFDLVERNIRLREEQAALYFRQLVAALAWCHSQVGGGRWRWRGRRLLCAAGPRQARQPRPSVGAQVAFTCHAPCSMHPALQGIVHRDIKLENLLLGEAAWADVPLLKLCDFGSSKCLLSVRGAAPLAGRL